MSLTEDDFENSTIQDDSDIPLNVLVSSLVSGANPDSTFVDADTGFRSQADAENFNEDLELPGENSGESVGRGKRKKKQNTLYASKNFWRHYDEDNAEVEEME